MTVSLVSIVSIIVFKFNGIHELENLYIELEQNETLQKSASISIVGDLMLSSSFRLLVMKSQL